MSKVTRGAFVFGSAILLFANFSTIAVADDSQPACSTPVDCYTQALEKLQAAQNELAHADAEIQGLRKRISISAPVGTVIPMFLSPRQIRKLAPQWLPADGSIVHDPDSPMYQQKLPDLRDRVVLGGGIDQSVLPDDPENVGGALSKEIAVTLKGRTDGAHMFDVQGYVHTVFPPRFTIDTQKDEVQSANHFHNVTVNGQVKLPIPRQPFRKLVYMVHCQE